MSRSSENGRETVILVISRTDPMKKDSVSTVGM